jgi:tRNA (adenine22-N1)-methyltransferase
MVRLSKRLKAVASLAGACVTLADVGTDHGYIPVYLVGCKRAERAIALDVNPGPLQRAKEHIRQYGMEGQVEARLSDGLAALATGEADQIVIAGMGGGLMMRILSEGQEVAREAKRLVLQPQSEIAAFRGFLWRNGYRIEAEEMVYEDGKYYPMMAVRAVGNLVIGQGDKLAQKFGALLLEGRHPVLKEYLLRQRGQKEGILGKLKEQGRGDIEARVSEIERDLMDIERALGYYA